MNIHPKRRLFAATENKRKFQEAAEPEQSGRRNASVLVIAV
jgi:hypothetical protein